MPPESTPHPTRARHPRQRFNSPSMGLASLLHAVGIASCLASFKYLVDFPTQVNDSYGWHFQYLTIIGLALTTLTFTLGLLADVTFSPRLFAAKNALAFCSTPLEVLVSLLYWSLRLIDRSLVLPDWVELSPWADVGFHAAPAVLLSLDLLAFSPPWALGARPALPLSAGLAVLYWFWIELCYSHNGWYPYPLFALVTAPWRGVVFATSAILMTLSTIFLKVLYEQINGVDVVAATKEKPRRRQ